MTVEHLLLCVCSTIRPRQGAARLRCQTIGKLRKDVGTFIEETTPLIAERDAARRSRRSASSACCSGRCSTCSRRQERGHRCQRAGRLFSEQDSQAVYLLNQQDVSRLDVVNYISHGISKVPGRGPG
jgi:ATP-dependent Clp protease ATP-binding subunit ClpA